MKVHTANFWSGCVCKSLEIEEMCGISCFKIGQPLDELVQQGVRSMKAVTNQLLQEAHCEAKSMN